MSVNNFKIFRLKHVITFLIVITFSSCSPNKRSASNDENNKLVIFHAGSLTVPFHKIASDFNKLYPDVEIQMEAAGSRTCARKISELNKPCDIMASADYTVIDNLLIPEHASWNIKFATNEMTIVYHDHSRYADDITADNWHEILLKEDVAFGRSDPNADPCGYRAVLTSKLAESYYGIEGLADQLLSKNIEFVRPKETDLLGLLESGAIDYIFLYRSVGHQHGLKYVVLPDSINLSNTAHKDFYATATVDISGKKPGETITKKGEPMVYGVTICNNAPNKEVATQFVNYLLLKDKGLAVMREKGQPDIVPSVSETYGNIPETLAKFALPATLNQ